MHPSVLTCKVTKYADWQEFLLHRVSNTPVHVLLSGSSSDVKEVISRLCMDPEVYAVYIYPDAHNILPEHLPDDCDTPVFVAADEAEAEAFAVRLTSGELTVLDRAINGDDMLYRFLAAHPT